MTRDMDSDPIAVWDDVGNYAPSLRGLPGRQGSGSGFFLAQRLWGGLCRYGHMALAWPLRLSAWLRSGRSGGETARVRGVITFEDCSMATNRSRRLRKKLCVDEFQVLLIR